jgi:hypothetical protein
MASGYSQSRTPSQSGTPGGSITSRRQRQSINPSHSRQTINPSTLAFYSHDIQNTLILAKDLFVAAAFASGFFFYHRRSPYSNVYQTFALEALGQASQDRESKYFHSITVIVELNLDYYIQLE